uniref:centrosomal protein of 78 kDa-like n=1 Tax=Styela clava TaxID=7725 RepID=UPI00193A2C13|nr:centrosomal protein of 78 kDa-like [Styela clava]
MSVAPESVSIRHRGSYDFETHYSSLCALQDTVPLLEVKAHLGQGVLDINSDKIRLVDWSPVLNSLRINKNLRFIAIRSYYSQSAEKDGEQKKSHYFKRRPPAIQSKDMTLRLAQAISECLKQTENLKCLDLQGIPFRKKDLAFLSKGLERNTTLTHVSLEYCYIGDQGCEQICEALKHHSSLTHLNYTGCGLTCKSAEAVAKLIKHQSTERHSEAWIDSLRYRQPNLNSMTGLRRITLNHNPMIGDEGVRLIAEALKDDLWLKAVDLQNCGIGRDGANVLIETLNQNKTLLVLDVRFNPLIDRSLLHTVIGQVLINSNGYDDKEFPWIKSEPPKDPYRTRPRRRFKQIGNTYGRKTSIRSAPRQSARSGRSQASPSHNHPGDEGFVPWRTAYRASQYKRTYTDNEQIGTPRYLQNPERTNSPEATIRVENEEQSSDDDDYETTHEQTPRMKKSLSRSRRHVSPDNMASPSKAYNNVIRELKIELFEARKTVAEERKARRIADQHATNLEIENVRLKRELEERNEVDGIRSSLDDDVLLESIETSFNKFHDFLDLLKQLGLGGLVAYAGMSDISFPLGDNQDKGREKLHKAEMQKVKTPSISEERSKHSTKESSRHTSQGTDVSEHDDVNYPPPITIHSQSTKGEEEATGSLQCAGDAGLVHKPQSRHAETSDLSLPNM